MVALGIASAQTYQDNLPVDHPAIRYFQGPLDDPVTRLAKQIEKGKARLDFREGGLGYLPSLLEHLGVNSDSQAMPFSKGSFQAGKIGPRNPRAIYFSDDVAVGFVRGGEVLEVTGLDPRQGIVFYTLDTQKSDHPSLVRRDVCLQCHQGPATLGVPGIFAGSVYPSPSGMPNLHSGAIVTDHRTPFEDRWGGWYVTGTHGGQRHRGNAVAPDPAQPDVLETEGTQNLANLFRKFDAAGYLTPLSDIVALMTLEHQTQMTNLLTRVGWEARMGRPIDAGTEDIASYMLFADEAPLREPVQGVSTFTRTFPARGPRDKRGRSLRDFDLHRRLFRYPLSYMVYSPAFDALPDRVRERIYQRLYDALTGKTPTRLPENDRRSIVEILRDTKPNLPAYWR